jgi:hypothetical protein
MYGACAVLIRRVGEMVGRAWMEARTLTVLAGEPKKGLAKGVAAAYAEALADQGDNPAFRDAQPADDSAASPTPPATPAAYVHATIAMQPSWALRVRGFGLPCFASETRVGDRPAPAAPAKRKSDAATTTPVAKKARPEQTPGVAAGSSSSTARAPSSAAATDAAQERMSEEEFKVGRSNPTHTETHTACIHIHTRVHMHACAYRSTPIPRCPCTLAFYAWADMRGGARGRR